MQHPGVLYLVATPIGNLGDFSARAIETLNAVDEILAEDTRRSLILLQHYGIKKRVQAFHEHNEKEKALSLVANMQRGASYALISDAGTPLICDPGFALVRLLHQHHIKVVPIPGPCSIITALCASGLPTDRFVFEGFLNAKNTTRKAELLQLQHETRTMIFFEVPHRILDSLQSLIEAFGALRMATLVRELTKRFETIYYGTLEEILNFVRESEKQQRGEFVLLVAGSLIEKGQVGSLSPEDIRILSILLKKLSLKEAVSITAEITGSSRNQLYEQALKFCE